MSDPVETIATQLVINVTGRALTWAGQQLWKLATEGDENAKKVLETAERKLTNDTRNAGPVSLRTFREFLEQAPFIEEEVRCDYFGGALASSRSGIERDDRGASVLQLIGGLSAYQLRAHFVLYTIAKQVLNGSPILISSSGDDSDKIRIFVPWSVFSVAMDFQPNETLDPIMSHVIFGLYREQLLMEFHYELEVPQRTRGDYSFFRWTEPGLLFMPTVNGVELFQWAHGMGSLPVDSFLDTAINFPTELEIEIPDGARVAPYNS